MYTKFVLFTIGKENCYFSELFLNYLSEDSESNSLCVMFATDWNALHMYKIRKNVNFEAI